MKAYIDDNNYLMIRFSHKGINHKVILKRKIAPSVVITKYWDRLQARPSTSSYPLDD